MYFIIPIILVAFFLVLLPLWVNFITLSEKRGDYWQPQLSSKARLIVWLIALCLHILVGVRLGKIGVEDWVFTIVMFMYCLYLIDGYLANKAIVIPHGRIEPGKNIYFRRFLFVFSLVMAVVCSVV